MVFEQVQARAIRDAKRAGSAPNRLTALEAWARWESRKLIASYFSCNNARTLSLHDALQIRFAYLAAFKEATKQSTTKEVL